MPKTEQEITLAHKRTIEAFTGKQCSITLTDKRHEKLKAASLQEILATTEHYNQTQHTIASNSVNRDVTRLRKIFCLLAHDAGHSAKKTGRFLNGRDHTTIMYNRKTGTQLLETNAAFSQLYEAVLKKITRT